MPDEPERQNVVAFVINNAREFTEADIVDDDGGDGGRKGGGESPPGPADHEVPVVPLGLSGDSYFYLDERGQLRELLAREHGRTQIIGLFGTRSGRLYELWPRLKPVKDKDTGEVGFEVTGWKPELACEWLMKRAAERGILDIGRRVRGVGGWRGPAGELVCHVGDGLIVSTAPGTPPAPGQRPGSRRTGQFGDHIYPAGPQQPRPADDDVPRGMDGPGEKLLAIVGTWSWARPELDGRLLVGHQVCQMAGGALVWRPAAWVTGDKSTGKSTLHKLLGEVQGDAVIQSADATPAGIWQRLGHASVPVAIDELEADGDNRRSRAVVDLARNAASGAVTLRGGDRHSGTEFTLSCCFFFSSVLVPPLRQAARSRLAILELEPLPKDRPALAIEAAEWRAVGRQLRRRLVDQWWRWDATIEAYRRELQAVGLDARAADTFGTLLAGADVALHDGPPDSDTVHDWAVRVAEAQARDEVEIEADHQSCLEHLMTRVLDVVRGGAQRPVSLYVIEAAEVAAPDDIPDPSPAAAKRALGTVGLGVRRDNGGQWLAVANSHQGVVRLFEGSHWAGASGTLGVWVQALRRVPRAWAGKHRFAGFEGRCTFVPMDAVLKVSIGPMGVREAADVDYEAE